MMKVAYSKEDIITNLRSANRQDENRVLSYLYSEYYGLIESFVLQNSGRTDDAGDVFQDALVVFFNKVQEPDFSLTCSVKTYLYSVSRNLWLDRLRQKSNRSRLLDAHEFTTVQEDDLKVLLENEHNTALYRLLQSAGSKCEEVLKLFYFYHKSMKEIAEDLGMASEAVARNKKHACLQKLRNTLTEDENLKELLSF